MRYTAVRRACCRLTLQMAVSLLIIQHTYPMATSVAKKDYGGMVGVLCLLIATSSLIGMSFSRALSKAFASVDKDFVVLDVHRMQNVGSGVSTVSDLLLSDMLWPPHL